MQNKKMTILNALNMIAITFYVVAIPGYYFFDYRIMNGVFGSCAAFLFLRGRETLQPLTESVVLS